MATFKNVEAALKYFNAKYGHDPRYYWNSLSRNEQSNIMKDVFGYNREKSFDELKKAINNKLFNKDGTKRDYNSIKKNNNYDTNLYYDRKANEKRKNFEEKEEIIQKDLHKTDKYLERLGDEYLVKGFIPRDGEEIPEELVEEVTRLLSRNMNKEIKRNSLQDAVEEIELSNPFENSPVKNYNNKEKINYWLFDLDYPKPKETNKNNNLALKWKYDKNFQKDDLFPYLDEFVNNHPDKYYLENSELPDVLEELINSLQTRY